MTEQEVRNQLKLLRASVARLAQPPGEQLAWLSARSLCLADELALEFDDVFPTVRGLIEQGIVRKEAASPLAGIDALLSQMSEKPAKWEPEALATDPDWEELRHRAQLALAVLPAAA